MKTKIIFLLLFSNITAITYSQVTIGTEEKKKQEEKIVLKPPPYDSLKNIEYQNVQINYYQYIGLKLYSFPVSYPKYETDRKNFLFSISPTIIKTKVKTEFYPFIPKEHEFKENSSWK